MQLIAKYQDDPAVLLDLGLVYAMGGMLREALAAWEAGVAASPTNELILARLTTFHARMGSAGEGLPWAERLIEVNPHVAEYRWIHSTLLDKAGRRDEAIKAAEAALERDPTAKVIRTWLVEAYRDKGRAADAEKQEKLLKRMQ